jgi:hypothetical protein
LFVVVVLPFLVVFVVEPLLVVERFVVVVPLVFVPVLLKSVRLPLVVGLKFVVFVFVVVVPAPPKLVLFAMPLRFAELLPFPPVSDEQVAPIRANAKSADNASIFLINNFSCSNN